MIWYALVLSLIIQVVMFIPAFFFKTDKLTDISYGLTFIILSIIVFLQQSFNELKLILLALVITWALRLASFLFMRIQKIKKDSRFDKMRGSFVKFLSFWILQGITVWVVLIPTIMFFNRDPFFHVLMPIGAVIWGIGLLIESAADQQKFKFKQQHKDRWADTGLWRYSRHPNYFGEILCWTGVYLFTVTAFSLELALATAVGPLFIIMLLLFVSGIPKLEKSAQKKWGQDPEYQAYKAKTSILIPSGFRNTIKSR
ncbi:DUF1295 domain-containing protein [Acidobacteriota bacterium]